LEDSIESDLLFHVIDASDTFVQERIDVVHEILENIGAKQTKILVFNKIDAISPERLQALQEIYKDEITARISAKDQQGLDELKKLLIEKLDLI
jgi:GTP-binding protein HflX